MRRTDLTAHRSRPRLLPKPAPAPDSTQRVDKAPRTVPTIDGPAVAQPLGGAPRIGRAAAARTREAAAQNLVGALESAAVMGAAASNGRVTARLKAAQTALDALGETPADLPRLRGLVTEIARRGGAVTGAAGPIAVELAARDRGRILDEARAASRSGLVDATIDQAPDTGKVTGLLSLMYPGAAALGTTDAALRAELDEDLAVGGLGAELQGILSEAHVPQAEIDALMGALAEVRAGFRAGTEASGLPDADRDMQRTNWIHTRFEVVKAARAFAATHPAPTDAAGREAHGAALVSTLLGTMTSDSFKDSTPHSLIWHNRPGAELVLPLLVGRHFAPSTRTDAIHDEARLVGLEHQITPALFMSGAVAGELAEAGVDKAIADGIVAKLANPAEAPAERGEIVFTPDEQAGLQKIGLPGWRVMVPDSPHFSRSQVVAFADVQQYAAHDGLMKIAIDIRDPEHGQPFMRDPNVQTAVNSSVGFSFDRGMDAIVDEGLRAIGHEAQADMKTRLETVIYPEVERRLRASRGVGEGEPTPAIPYWNADVPTEPGLDAETRAAVDEVKSILRDVLAADGAVNVDPFGR